MSNMNTPNHSIYWSLLSAIVVPWHFPTLSFKVYVEKHVLQHCWLTIMYHWIRCTPPPEYLSWGKRCIHVHVHSTNYMLQTFRYRASHVWHVLLFNLQNVHCLVWIILFTVLLHLATFVRFQIICWVLYVYNWNALSYFIFLYINQCAILYN